MTSSRPFAAIVFDLDGTLVDSAPDIHAAAIAMLRGLGRPDISLEQTVSFVGEGVRTLVERCLAATGDAAADADAIEAAAAAFRTAYDAAPAALTRQYPHVAELLQRLSAAGVPLGVCTNKPEALAVAILDQLGLAGHFACIVGGDRLPVRKPDPAPLKLCFDALSVAPAAGLYVGDSEIDDATAKAAAAPFALFSGGYRKAPIEAFQAALVFDRHSDLATWIDRPAA